MADTLENLSAQQFGPRAGAYVTSPVHAYGADLDWIGACLADRPSASVLDVGCGGGHVTYRVAPHVHSVIACDPSVEMLRVVEATVAARGFTNVRTALAPAERLPFGDRTFDAAATRFSAHHWGRLEDGLREAGRVLKSRGSFFVVDAASPGVPLLDTHLQAIEVLRDASHVRNYSASEWIAALRRAGFEVEELRTSRVHIEFASWIERMQTPDVAVGAIRRLQGIASENVRNHFGIEADGSFDLDTVWIAARSHP